MSQEIISTLKVRIFDLSEELTGAVGRIKELEDVLGKLVEVLNVSPDEKGSIKLEAIVEAAKSLVLTGDAESDKIDDVDE